MKIICKYFFIPVLLFTAMIFFACGSTPESTASSTVQLAAKLKGPVYSGNGGKGVSLTVLEPMGKNMPPDERWLLALIQGSLTADFQKYSAMTITDRQNLDGILSEQELGASGIFSDDDYISIGKLTNAKNALIGSVTKTPLGYMIELSVTETESGERKASFGPKPCTPDELQNLSVAKEAAEDLLAQMGVQLTDEGRSALLTVNVSSTNAEIALSKGIAAQKGGTVVEALAYYYQAAGFDSSLLEAVNRASVMSAGISSGNIGMNVRNDIQRRKEWEKILTEAENYFSKHLPFEIIYDTALIQGKVDYQQETVNLSTFVSINALKESFKVFDAITKGLEITGKRREWGFGFWPVSSRLFSDQQYSRNTTEFTYAMESIDLEIGLFNDRNSCISRTDIELNGMVHFARGRKMKEESYDYGYIIIDRTTGTRYSVDTTKLEFVPISTIRFSPTSSDGNPVIFLNINANDITDNMKVKIISINGIDAERAMSEGYIRITMGSITPREWIDVFKSF